MTSPQAEYLREVAAHVNDSAAHARESNVWDNSQLQYWIAEWFENEADRIDDTPYMVDHDWIERNYRTVLGAARAYMGRVKAIQRANRDSTNNRIAYRFFDEENFNE